MTKNIVEAAWRSEVASLGESSGLASRGSATAMEILALQKCPPSAPARIPSSREIADAVRKLFSIPESK